MTWDTQRLGTVGDFQNCEKPNDLGHGTPGGTRAGSPDPRLGTLGGAGAGTPAPRQDGSDLHEPQAQAMSRSVSRSELSLVLNVTVISMPQLNRESIILN